MINCIVTVRNFLDNAIKLFSCLGCYRHEVRNCKLSESCSNVMQNVMSICRSMIAQAAMYHVVYCIATKDRFVVLL